MASRRCPICGAPAVKAEQEAFPFCSRRCKTIDLGNWLGGHYRVPEDDPFGRGTEPSDEDFQ